MGKLRFWVYIADYMPKDKRQELVKNIETHYPVHMGEHYRINDSLYAVRSDKVSALIAEQLGIGPETGLMGLVKPVQIGNGYFSANYIEWDSRHD